MLCLDFFEVSVQAILDDLFSLFYEPKEAGYQGYIFLFFIVVLYRFFPSVTSHEKKRIS